MNRAICLLAVALAAGCACEDHHCGVDPNRPRFGEGTEKLFHDIGQLPNWTAHEFAWRGHNLSEYGKDWAYNRGVEVDRTTQLIEDLPSNLRDEFTVRGAQMVDFFDRQGQRAETDACCFFERAWHSIKLAGRF
jgi:hypothetical protein